jgi:hypothetical protein
MMMRVEARDGIGGEHLDIEILRLQRQGDQTMEQYRLGAVVGTALV